MLLFVLPALAREPVLMPLSADPVVGDRTARLGLLGNADSLGSVDGALLAEVGIASRVALAARAGLAAGDDEPLLGLEARVEILDEDAAPVGLGALARYKREGFDGADGEIEATLAASRSFGQARALLNLTGGTDIGEPEGDLEAALALTHPVGSLVHLGFDARGRFAVGEEEHESEEEDRAERRGWDTRAGALASAGTERVSGFLFAGGTVIGEGEEEDGENEVRAGALASVGVQVAF